MWYVVVAVVFFILGAFVGNQITVKSFKLLMDEGRIDVRFKDAA